MNFSSRLLKEEHHLSHAESDIQNFPPVEVEEGGQDAGLDVISGLRSQHFAYEEAVLPVEGELFLAMGRIIGAVEFLKVALNRGGRDEASVTPGAMADDELVRPFQERGSPAAAEWAGAWFQVRGSPRGEPPVEG